MLDLPIQNPPADAPKVFTPVRSPRQIRNRLSPTQVDELVAAYQAGSSLREVAKQFAVHRGTALDHLKRRGVGRRPKHVIKLSDQQVVDAAERYEQGESIAGLAEEFDVSRTTMRDKLREHGVKLRWGRANG